MGFPAHTLKNTFTFKKKSKVITIVHVLFVFNCIATTKKMKKIKIKKNILKINEKSEKKIF